MVRWEGDAQGRLERAALELFDELGYDRTTVAQLAARANLTERSFYRWYPDKREVLFGGSTDLEDALVTAIDTVPAATGPLPTLLAAMGAAAAVFRPREFLRRRSAVIAANPPLQERELIKLAALTEALTAALVARGAQQTAARLAAEVGMAVMRRASELWLADDGLDYADAVLASSTELLGVVEAAKAKPRRRAAARAT